jgi:hypothetical protein
MNTSILFKKSFQHAALISVVTLAAFGTSNSFAAKSADTTAAAQVFQPIEISTIGGLNFGQFAPGSGGNLVVSTGSVRVGPGLVLSSVGAPPQAASFEVSGNVGATFGITITSTPMTHADGVETMALDTTSVDDASDVSDGEDVSASLLVDNSEGGGGRNITVGGSLTVADDQLAGNYTGTITAAVEYN